MAGTTTNRSYPYATSSDPNDVGYITQTLAEAIDADVDEISERNVMASGSAALYGSYTGQPLKVKGGYAEIDTNASSLASLALGTSFTGLKALVVTSLNDTYNQVRLVGSPASANTVQIVMRKYDGTGAGTQSDLPISYIAIGW